MASRPSVGRFTRLAAVLALVTLALPAAVSATPRPDSCASNRAVTYSGSVPEGLRAPGTKLIQWRGEYTDAASGELVVDDGIYNEVTFDGAAPIYRKNVLIRLFSSTAILANGEVIFLDAINPAQAARMHAQVSWYTSEKFFTGDFVLSFRYETATDVWSAWYPMTAGPESSLCPETTKAIWKRNFGWQEG